PPLPGQHFEEISHGLGIEARTREIADTDAVGFRLLATREIDLLLNCEALCRSNATLDRLSAAMTNCPDQDGRQHGRHGRHGLLTLRADRPRDMVLRDVRDLVAEYARELGLAVGSENEPVVD